MLGGFPANIFKMYKIGEKMKEMIMEKAVERIDHLEQLGYDIKSCWCLDCLNVGKCGTCTGMGKTFLGFIERPPKHYRKLENIIITDI